MGIWISQGVNNSRRVNPFSVGKLAVTLRAWVNGFQTVIIALR